MRRAMSGVLVLTACGALASAGASFAETFRAGTTPIMTIEPAGRTVTVRSAGQTLRVTVDLSQGVNIVSDEGEPNDGLTFRVGGSWRYEPTDDVVAFVQVSTNARQFRDPIVSARVVVSGADGTSLVPVAVQPVQTTASRFVAFRSPPAAPQQPQFSKNFSRGSGVAPAMVTPGENVQATVQLRTRSGRVIRVPLGSMPVNGPFPIRSL